MTSSTPLAPTTETAKTLALWAGLAAAPEETPGLAALFRAFQERVQRLYAIDVNPVEFDFLRPTDG